MAEGPAYLLDLECDRLDSHANAFSNNTHVKRLRLKLAEVQYLRNVERCRLVQNSSLGSWLTYLTYLYHEVDELIDDLEQSQKPKSKIEQQARNICQRLVRHLDSLPSLPNADSSVLEREKDPDGICNFPADTKLLVPESSGSGLVEAQSERVPDANTASPAALDRVLSSTMEFVSQDEITSPLQADMLPSNGSEIQLVMDIEEDGMESVKPAAAIAAIELGASNITAGERVRSSPLPIGDRLLQKSGSGLFEAQGVPDANTASPAEVRASTMELVSQDEMTSPLQADIFPSNESEIQLVMDIKEDGMESVQPAAATAAIELGISNITAGERVRSSPLPIGDRLLQKSGLEDKKSIKSTVRKIIKHMNDVRAAKIGVHGIGGIGKTTVLKSLISYPKLKNMFEVILLVTVSRYWSTRKIQNQVLRQLSLCCELSGTDSQVAEKLSQVLKGKKFLLILDDVWEHIDLHAVGIPDPCTKKGSKILMASRKLDVCHNMDVVKVIEVETISWKEAIELFNEQLGRIFRSPDIQPFVKAIVKGCGGLPLLIIATGRALAEENDVSVWEDASRKFSPHRTARACQIEDVVQLLKFSFDRLRGHDVKSCFLHFALFPEDREVSTSKFIDYCIQEGIVTGAQALAHKRGLEIVNVLEHASLLQVSEDDDSIEMHDLIRDLALGILSSEAEGSQFLLRAYARRKELLNPERSSSSNSGNRGESSRLSVPEGHQFLLRARAGLTEPPLVQEWEQAKMIFLMDNDLRSLPERPSCPELFALFLQRNAQLRTMPNSFFDLMTSLKTLNLSKTRINSLPKTLFRLKNLQILILQDCERLDILPSEVGCLEKLEVLDLQGTEIHKLPDEVGKLASLKDLKVSFYGSIDGSESLNLPSKLISSGTLSRLQTLETLSIVVHPGDERWYEDVKSVESEISKLRKLISLSFHFPEVEHVQHFLKESIPWKDQSLSEFRFVVGPDVESIASRVPDYVEFDYNQQLQCLRFVNGEEIPDEVLQILARCAAFYLDHHIHIKSLSDLGFSNVDALKYCIISECPEIIAVVHVEEHAMALFPRLETLSIHHLWNLTCIWKGIVPKGSFAELRTLSVHACPKLEYVFKRSLTLSLLKLEELSVQECPAIEEIVVECEMEDPGCIILPSLKKLMLHSLPELVYIWRSAWPSLEYISFYDCPKLKRIGMDSKLERTIIEIEAEKSWWDTLEWEDTELRLNLEKNLTSICEHDM